MKPALVIIITLVTLCNINLAHSGSVVNTTIIKIRVDNDGRAMIFFNTAVTPPAACSHTAYSSALGIDAATPGGQAVLSMALAAKATGAPVTAHGFSYCGVYGGSNIETWNHGFIK